jgi:subtilisin family serine protease
MTLAVDPNVKYIEANTWEWHVSCTTETPSDSGLWGLARISHRALTGTTHMYDTTGAGVTVYIADTGIRETHNEFGSRVTEWINFTTDSAYTDENGHGTHCAGTVGGSAVGVAKDVTLKSSKCLNSAGSGLTTWVVSGIEWAASNCGSNERCVLSMSLGGGASTALDTAVEQTIAAGVTTVVAAGNSNADACRPSTTDARASFSNYGSCLDVFARLCSWQPVRRTAESSMEARSSTQVWLRYNTHQTHQNRD